MRARLHGLLVAGNDTGPVDVRHERWRRARALAGCIRFRNGSGRTGGFLEPCTGANRRGNPDSTMEVASRFRVFAFATLASASVAPVTRAQTPLEARYHVTTFSTAQGLPSQAMTDLTQTADGYLWVVAGGILSRFDGFVFRDYTADTSPLLSRRVASLHAGRGDTLWIVDERNAVLALANGQVSEVMARSGPGISAVVQSGRGLLYGLADSARLLRRAPSDSSPAPLLVADDLTDSFLWWRDARGSTWLVDAKSGAVRAVDGGPTDTSRVTAPTLVPAPSRRAVYEVRRRGRFGDVVDGTGRTLFTYRASPGITARLVDRDDRLWVTTAAGVEIYLPGTADPAQRLTDLAGQSNLHIFQGRSGCIWLAQASLFRGCRTAFRTVTRDVVPGSPEMVVARGPGDSVLLVDVPGTLVIATADGRRVVTRGAPNDVPVFATHADRRATIWSTRSGTARGVLRGGAEVVLPQPDVHLFAGHLERDDELWYAGPTHIYRAAPYAGDGPQLMDSVPHHAAAVIAMSVTRSGVLWAVVRNRDQSTRLLRVDQGTATELGPRDGLPSSALRTVAAEDDGTVWLGTYGGGLTRLRDGQFRSVRQSNGLAEDVVTSVLADDGGNLWLGGNRSIHRVSRTQVEDFLAGRVPRVHGTGYATADGIDDPETTGATGDRDARGLLWFPTMGGAVVVDPRLAVRLDSTQPIVHVLGIRSDRDSISTDPWAPTPGAPRRLTLGARRLAFAFTAISLRNPAGVRYQYRVDGVDDQWIDAGDARLVTYNHIGQGTYTFRVRAIGPGGIPGANEGRASFTVPAYPYETPAFFALSLVFVGLLGWLVFELRVRQLRRREVELTCQVEVRTRKLEAALETVAEQSDALRTLDEAKSRFFANVSHEFRTPLSLILGPANDLRAGRAGALPVAARRLLDNVTTNADRLMQLVEQLLDVARLESATLHLSAEVQDLIPLVRRMADSFASLAEQRGIAFRLSHPVGAVRVRYDTDKMEKIIGNLVGNALKFTPAGGSVALRCGTTTSEPAEAVLEIQDSGPGIAPAHRQRVFERFYQVDDSPRRAHEGLGIGLALVKELVELHGGQITLQSEEGAGCTFTVRLPVAPATPRSVDRQGVPKTGSAVVRSARTPLVGSPTREPRPARASENEDVVTVLVVEDNVELLEFLGDHLAERYRVLTAPNGVRGLAIAREHVPDLIISDVMMPEMDGLSLCEAIKQDPEIDFIPIILLTAKASRDSRLAGLRGGADDYLAKPVDLVELMVRAENLIRSRHRVRERYRAERRDLPVMQAPLKAGLLDASNRALVEKFYAIVDDRLGDESFDVEAMAVAMGLSRATLYRKLGAALGTSPVDALWDYRMAQAAQWLEETPITVSEVAYGVGFKSVPHFCAKFRARYGETASAYRRIHQQPSPAVPAPRVAPDANRGLIP